jgi:hypothetical protein
LRQSFDLGATIVNTRAPGSRDTLQRPEPCVGRIVFFPTAKGRNPMTSTTTRTPEQPDQQAKNERDKSEKEKRPAREKALDQALEDSFPASDPVAMSQPAPAEE